MKSDKLCSTQFLKIPEGVGKRSSGTIQCRRKLDSTQGHIEAVRFLDNFTHCMPRSEWSGETGVTSNSTKRVPMNGTPIPERLKGSRTTKDVS